MYNTYPSKSSPVNPSEQIGQTSPGLKSTKTGQYTQTFPSKVKGSGKLTKTPTPKAGTETFPKSGAKQSRPGEVSPNAPSVKSDGKFNLAATQKPA